MRIPVWRGPELAGRDVSLKCLDIDTIVGYDTEIQLVQLRSSKVRFHRHVGFKRQVNTLRYALKHTAT